MSLRMIKRYVMFALGLVTFAVISNLIINVRNWNVHNPDNIQFTFPNIDNFYMPIFNKSGPVLRYTNHSRGTLTVACKTCAYVVASGHMTKSANGPEIDANDCVFRSNDSPTTDYEDDVGEKTTMRVVDFVSLSSIRNIILSKKTFDKFYKNMTFVYIGNTTAKNHAIWNLIHQLKTEYPAMQFVKPTAEFSRYIGEQYKFQVDNDWPSKSIWISSGFQTILLMRELCSKIAVYGMAYANYCFVKAREKVKYHYYGYQILECEVYERHAKAKNFTHRFLREKLAFEMWRLTWKNLEFRSPLWPNHETEQV